MPGALATPEQPVTKAPEATSPKTVEPPKPKGSEEATLGKSIPEIPDDPTKALQTVDPDKELHKIAARQQGDNQPKQESTQKPNSQDELFDESRFREVNKVIDAASKAGDFSGEQSTQLIETIERNGEVLRVALSSMEHFDDALRSLQQLINMGSRLQIAEIQNLGTAIVAERLPQLQTAIQTSTDGVRRDQIMHTIALLEAYGTPEQGVQAASFLLKNFDSALRTSMLSKPDRSYDYKYLRYLATVRQHRGISGAESLLQPLLRDSNPEIRSFAYRGIDYLKKTRFGEFGLRNLIPEIISGAGLDYDRLKIAWGDARGDPATEALSIMRLEKYRPGICKTLTEEFGIQNFSRYPDEMLVAQYNQRDNQESPYGVVIFPKADYNGAFSVKQKVLGQFFAQINRLGYVARIYEAGTKIGFARVLIGASRRYGSHKISFALIGGHGSKDTIQLGRSDWQVEKGHLLSQDLLGKGVQQAHRLFEPGATIILDSCSTGEFGGIAHQMSKIGGWDARLNIKAPMQPTNIADIRVSVDQDKKQLKFDVGYFGTRTMRYTAGSRQSSAH